MSDADEMVAFLLAQYDKDEQTARAAEQANSASLTAYAEDPRATVTGADLTNRWSVGEEEDQEGGWSITAGTYTEIRDGRTQIRPSTVVGPGYTGGGAYLRETAEHIARHDPARVLAEVDAKRRIITELEEANEYLSRPEHRHIPAGEVHGLYTALRLLALPFASRDGYKDSWRP